jgi:tetratricopeptide (TPR) repeat protein
MEQGVSRTLRNGLLLLLALFVSTRTASAQSQTSVALAETLYQQARDLMAEGRYDEACPKLEESQRLDPATGTLLNLASCHEKQGKLATAWFEYLDAVTLARRDARPDRVTFAQGRLAELEPKLSRLTLVVPKAFDYPGLEIELDGARIGPAARDVPTPVDPGTHVVEARAPGRQSVRLSVEVGTVAEQKTVTLPELPASAPTAAGLAPVPPPQAPKAPPPAPAERPVPTTAYVTGAVTVGLLAGAIVTGVLYAERKSDYEKTLTEDDYDAARALGIVNAILWIGVASGAGLTTYIYVTRPEAPRTSATRLVPAGGVLNLSGSF